MKKMTHALLALSFTLAFAACGSDENAKPPTEATPSLSSAISECGGFTKALTYAPSDAAYCDAEAIEWRYDEATSKLSIIDKRVLLNCCGTRSAEATWTVSGLVIKEKDMPEEGGARCNCLCTFDFEVTVDFKDISTIAQGPLSVRIERDVTDEGTHTDVYQGELDFTLGSGRIVVDESDVSGFCEEPTDPQQPENTDLTKAFSYSECGGFERAQTSEPVAAYCDAEMMRWNYDSASQTLLVSDERVLLNCCGERSVKITQDNLGKLTITERDEPVDGARCNCMCVFDFDATATLTATSPVPFELVREVVDNGSTTKEIVATGTIDLRDGSGSLIVDDSDVAPWCEE